MPSSHDHSPDNPYGLAPPGAGIPWLERVASSFALQMLTMTWSDRQAIKAFQRESQKLDRISEDSESYDVFQRLLIPRVIGIEDSSRNWSVMMILEHLTITNADMLKAIEALCAGIVPRGEIDVALYKPDEELDWGTLDRYRDGCTDLAQRLTALIETNGSLSSGATFAHPWFGQLDGHGWACLTAAHQMIHRRHAQKLVAMLGVT